jgi:hypothetical protein
MRLLTTLLVLMATASSAHAQDWEIGRGVTTAQLSADGWRLVGTAALPNQGGGAVVTFWEGHHQGSPVTARCITSFNMDLEVEVEVCGQPVIREDQ